ncbi:hypothetical protein HWV62_7884 [Athelia sp. TMB]|nr:hypothetical protein HWV62_32501 [Athelia sp. TMB]KAF7985234.1 hypothetical protein HWV62_7884 [Athelia sp. TMB]
MGWKNVNAIIENKLYIGNILSARSSRSLTERRITHILSVCPDPIPAELPESGLTHRRIPVEDVDYADLLTHLPAACQYIEESMRAGGTVLVHCVQGLSRSATVIAAYCTGNCSPRSIRTSSLSYQLANKYGRIPASKNS